MKYPHLDHFTFILVLCYIMYQPHQSMDQSKALLHVWHVFAHKDARRCNNTLALKQDLIYLLLFLSPSKVDMFSYGMVLYELLSGRRPTLGHHQLQTAKKLSKGIRPLLGSPEEVQFCCLHSLLTECWDTKPEKVRSLPVYIEVDKLEMKCLQNLLN